MLAVRGEGIVKPGRAGGKQAVMLKMLSGHSYTDGGGGDGGRCLSEAEVVKFGSCSGGGEG